MRIAKPFRFSYTYALIALNLALIVGFGLSSPSFFSLSTLRGTIMLTAEIGIMALPLTLLIIMGCTDFSMCAILTLSASLGGMACRATGSELLGVLVMLAIGALCGLFNGAMVAKLRLPPLISTLATQYLFRGITEGIVLGTGYGINVATTGAASFMGSGNILGVMTQLWLFAMLAVAFGAVLRRTVYGRLLYAIGMNESASRFAGINMNGGHGSIGGTCLGVAVIGILKSGMNFVQLPQTQQKIFLGIILLVSLIASEVIARGEKRLKPRRS